jgi:hypothetical protein
MEEFLNEVLILFSLSIVSFNPKAVVCNKHSNDGPQCEMMFCLHRFCLALYLVCNCKLYTAEVAVISEFENIKQLCRFVLKNLQS